MKAYKKMTLAEKAKACASLINGGAVGYFAKVRAEGHLYEVTPEDGSPELMTAADLVRSVERHLGVDNVAEMVEPEWEVVIPSEHYIMGCTDEFDALRQLDYVRVVLKCRDAYINKRFHDHQERYVEKPLTSR